MASCWITEYAFQARDEQGYLMAAGDEPSLDVQQLTLSGVSQQITLNARTKIVRLHADAAFHFAVGADPTASMASTRCAAGSSEYFGVQSHINKASNKIAFIEG